MKQFLAGALTAAAAFALGVLLPGASPSRPAVAAPVPPPKFGFFEAVDCRTLTVRSRDGRHRVEVTSAGDSVGIWVVNDATATTFAVFTQGETGPYFGLDDRGDGERVFPLAFTLEAGVPHLQMPRGKDHAISSLPLPEPR